MSTKYKLATLKKNSGNPPVWMMRQAGRYQKSYRAIRENSSFLDMIHNPDLATQITLAPIQEFGFDAAIVFSDILVTATALGCNLEFIENVGPVIDNPIRTWKDLERLTQDPHPEHNIDYVYQTLRKLKPELEKTNTHLIGFAGAPFTVASYMVEGGSSPNLKTIKTLLFSEPKLIHALLERLATLTANYLIKQVEAGAGALQLFDTWANHLSVHHYKEIALPYINTIIATVKKHSPDIPISLFCKGTTPLLPLLNDTQADIISIDWQTPLPYAVKHLPNKAIQGNLDPILLFGDPKLLEKEVKQILQTMKDHPGYIFNLGHGILPKTPEENVRLVVETVQNY